MALWHVMRSEFYMTPDDNKLSGWTEKKLQSTPQSQTCTKKRSQSLGDLLLVWSTTTFWIPEKPLHLRSLLSKLMRSTKNCSAYSWHWSTERAQFFSTTMCDIYIAQSMFQKLYELGYKVLPYPPYSPDFSTNQVPLLQASPQLFAGKMLPQPAISRKCFPRVHWILKHGCYTYRNKQTSVWLANTCWL